MKSLIILILAVVIYAQCPAPEPKLVRVRLTVPPQLYDRAKLTAKLTDDLIQSVKNDADHNKLDLTLEREIADLSAKLYPPGFTQPKK